MTNIKTFEKRGIKLSDTEALENALDKVNGKAERWTLNVNCIVKLAEDAEKQLANAGLSNSARSGALAVFYGYAPASKSYRNSVITTKMTLKRCAEGWRVMNLETNRMNPADSRRGEIFVKLTQEQYRKAEKFALGHFEKLAA